MKTLLYANRAEPKSISVISILLLAAAGDITKLRCLHRECYIFASQNLWYFSDIYPIMDNLCNLCDTTVIPTINSFLTKCNLCQKNICL